MVRSSPESEILVEEIGDQKFSLTVTFADQRFECGTYISRAGAMQAGRLFVTRKEGEQIGRQKRPHKNEVSGDWSGRPWPQKIHMPILRTAKTRSTHGEDTGLWRQTNCMPRIYQS